jgi:hypothetical protein
MPLAPPTRSGRRHRRQPAHARRDRTTDPASAVGELVAAFSAALSQRGRALAVAA